MNDTLFYFITKACDSCNECVKVCERNAIEPGEPYYISAKRCEACGKCAAACSRGAIIAENDPYRLINREADSFFGGGVWITGRNWWETDMPNQ